MYAINFTQKCHFQVPIQIIIDLSKVKDFSISKASKIIITKLGKAFELFKNDLTIKLPNGTHSRTGRIDSVAKIHKKDSTQKIKQKDSATKIEKESSAQKIEESSKKLKGKRSVPKAKRKGSVQKVRRKDSVEKDKSEDSVPGVKQNGSRRKPKKKAASKGEVGKKPTKSKLPRKKTSQSSASGDSSKDISECKSPSETALPKEDSQTTIKRNLSWPIFSQCPLCQEMQELNAATKSHSCTADFKDSGSAKLPSNDMQDNSTNTGAQDDVRTTMSPNSKFALKSFSTKVKLSSISAPLNLKLRKELHINDSDNLNALHAQESCTNINEKFEKCPTLCSTEKSEPEKSEKTEKLSVTTIFKIPTNKDLSREASEKNGACGSNPTQNNEVSTTVLYSSCK